MSLLDAASSLDPPEQLSSLALGEVLHLHPPFDSFLLKIDSRVPGISTLARLVVESASFKRNMEINMQMNENGWRRKNR